MFSFFAVHEESPVSLVNRPLSFPVELGLLGRKRGGGGSQKSTSLPNVAAGTSLQDVLRCLVLKGYTKGLASFSVTGGHVVVLQSVLPRTVSQQNDLIFSAEDVVVIFSVPPWVSWRS